MLVVATVFLLPQFVSEPWVAVGTDDLPPVPEASPSTVAPSTAAELTRFRQESQGVLAEIMAIRDRLQQSSVERWAEVEFQDLWQRSRVAIVSVSNSVEVLDRTFQHVIRDVERSTHGEVIGVETEIL